MISSPSKVLEVGSLNGNQPHGSATTASFSPTKSMSMNSQRRTVLVQQKSPLLVATPAQITKALAFSHPFLLPLNKLVGLITWSSGDPWESFLVVAVFWGLVLYGDAAIRWAGPFVVVVALILGMYSRRYSPLSSKGRAGKELKGRSRVDPEGTMRQQKSLDEILDTLNVLTSRCNILLDPLLELTDFLSTQQTATSATTRPALTTLFIRILLVTPVWVILALPPFKLITSQRVVLVFGTLFLSWHSRPARVTRTILWRSVTVRYMISVITGLCFVYPMPRTPVPPPLPPRGNNQHDVANSLASNGRAGKAGVRFTFTVYENQRRWLGLGWTSSLFAYERAAWTDEHLNPSSAKESFELPAVQNGDAKWQWVPGSEWHHEGSGKVKSTSSGKSAAEGWVYYDNKWNDGRRQDGWGRYTRRRKWYRDAELVEGLQSLSTEPTELPAVEIMTISTGKSDKRSAKNGGPDAASAAKSDDDASSSQLKRRRFFRRDSKTSAQSSNQSNKAVLASDEEQDQLAVPERSEREGDWDVGDELKMGLG